MTTELGSIKVRLHKSYSLQQVLSIPEEIKMTWLHFRFACLFSVENEKQEKIM